MGIPSWPRKHFIVCILFVLPVLIMGNCTCDSGSDNIDKSKALKYKIGAIASILGGGAIGVCLPILGKNIPSLRPETDVFFIVKAFAAGVILATGFIHVLPDAFASLTSPSLSCDPWANFPFTGFIAMTSAIGTLLIDAFATSYYSSKSHSVKLYMSTDGGHQAERGGRQEMQQVHTHSTHAHGHGSIHAHGHGSIHAHVHGSTQLPENSTSSQLLRHRVISQVLELGIIVHSVIIGIALGASQDPKTIRPLVAALTFHQFFEGMGLGGCITQAKFKARAVIVMAIFFSLTTPVGIAIGIGISNVYNENSPTALIVEGVFNSASAGILIYMALVDLLAADFMNSKIQKNGGLQARVAVSLLIGSGCMSVLAKWA